MISGIEEERKDGGRHTGLSQLEMANAKTVSQSNALGNPNNIVKRRSEALKASLGNFDSLKVGNELQNVEGHEVQEQEEIEEYLQPSPDPNKMNEIYSYLAANNRIEIRKTETKKEQRMFKAEDMTVTIQTRYLTVKAENSNGKVLQKRIKILLADHHKDDGKPYKYKLQEDSEDEEEKEKALERGDDPKPQGKDKAVSRKKSKSCGFNLDFVRSLVSTNKTRLVMGNFNLDMTYITNRIIACGYPAESFESLYRNKKTDVVAWLKRNHGNMVKIYNLCAETKYQYTVESLQGCALGEFPFCDHNISNLRNMYNFCLDATLFLQRMEQYHQKTRDTVTRDGRDRKAQQPVIVVHCKAGKGRTGMMICALLVFIGMFQNPRDAIKHYNNERAYRGKALTIQSQIRYVKFFVGFLHHKLFKDTYLPEDGTFFEKALREYNYLNFAKIFEDMRGEMLDLSTLCLGPFDKKIDFDIILSTLYTAEKKNPVIKP
jgi:hypothetical protein